MNKKKILIVSNFFYPENTPRAFRTTELAKEFARQGHDVTVLTPKINVHYDFEKEYHISIKDLGQPKWTPIELNGSGISLLAKRSIRRLSNLLLEYPDIELVRMVSNHLKKESGYDLLISIAVPFPIHWGVAKARTKKHQIAKIWVADCGDPYIGAENDTFSPPFYFKYVEKWFSKKTDYISIPVETAIPAYYPEFHDKIRIIPQGFRFEDVIAEDTKLRNKFPHFAYAGSLIPFMRDPTEFLKYLNSLDQDFRFDIYTQSVSLIKKEVDKSNGRMRIYEYIPRKELLQKLSACDFVVNFENKGSKQIPSKLIDYVILKKPILSIKTGEANEKLVKEFLSGNYRNSMAIKNIDQYRIEKVTREFLSLT